MKHQHREGKSNKNADTGKQSKVQEWEIPPSPGKQQQKVTRQPSTEHAHTHTHTHTHNCSSTLERNVLCQDSSHYAKAKLEKHTDGSIQNIFLVWFRGLKPQERNAGTGQECLSHTHPVAAGLMLKWGNTAACGPKWKPHSFSWAVALIPLAMGQKEGKWTVASQETLDPPSTVRSLRNEMEDKRGADFSSFMSLR